MIPVPDTINLHVPNTYLHLDKVLPVIRLPVVVVLSSCFSCSAQRGLNSHLDFQDKYEDHENGPFAFK